MKAHLHVAQLLAAVTAGSVVSGAAIERDGAARSGLAPSDAPPTSQPGKITWGACPDPDTPPELDRGRILGPLDHANPPCVTTYNSTNSVELFMSRLKAKPLASAKGGRERADEQTKSLIVNPGGPGVAAWTLLVSQLQGEMSGFDKVVVTPDIRAKYDVIALDPRGVGLSQGLQCDDGLLADRPDAVINDEEQFKVVEAWNKRYATSCLERSGDLVRFMDTVSVANDSELVRQDKLNLYGMSYGSQIGAHFISLYPAHVGRFLLDGILHHTQDARELIKSDAAAFEETLTAYFEWCDVFDQCRDILATAETKPRTTADLFDSLMARLADERLPAPKCTDDAAGCVESVGMRDFTQRVQEGLGVQKETEVIPEGWLALTSKMVEAVNGDASAFAASRMPEGGDGGQNVGAYFSSPHAGTAVSCLDNPRIETYDEYKDIMTELTSSPDFTLNHTHGQCWASRAIVDCIGWPIAASNPPQPLDKAQTAKSAQVMLLSSTVDPSTNMQWAESMHEQLPNSTWVVRDGAGHTSFTLFGESSMIAEKYLLDGELPKDGTKVKS